MVNAKSFLVDQTSGFVYVQEFLEEGTAGHDAAKPTAVTDWDENGHSEDGFDSSTADEEVHADEKSPTANGGPAKFDHDSTANGDTIFDATSANTKDSEEYVSQLGLFPVVAEKLFLGCACESASSRQYGKTLCNKRCAKCMEGR